MFGDLNPQKWIFEQVPGTLVMRVDKKLQKIEMILNVRFVG